MEQILLLPIDLDSGRFWDDYGTSGTSRKYRWNKSLKALTKKKEKQGNKRIVQIKVQGQRGPLVYLPLRPVTTFNLREFWFPCLDRTLAGDLRQNFFSGLFIHRRRSLYTVIIELIVRTIIPNMSIFFYLLGRVARRKYDFFITFFRRYHRAAT